MLTDISGIKTSPDVIGNAASATKINEQSKEDKFKKTSSVVKNDETYFSPIVKIDAEAQRAFFIYRDKETGEVKQQFPPEQVSESYLRSGNYQSDTVDKIKDNIVSTSTSTQTGSKESLSDINSEDNLTKTHLEQDA